MKINKLYEYFPLEKVTHKDGTRYYVDPEGNHLSSVTTILSATSHSPELEAWRKRVGDREADRIRDEACGLGTLMHTHLENHILGIERPGGNNLVRQLARNMADKVVELGLTNVDEVWGMESVLYFPGLYAGTTDLVSVHKGQPAICDYKTARKMKSRAMIGDYFLQLAAYAMAHDEIHGTDIQKGVIFMVDRDLNFQEFSVEGEEWKQSKEAWFQRVTAFLQVKLELEQARLKR
jgi:genome maintenance exonuclease 1